MTTVHVMTNLAAELPRRSSRRERAGLSLFVLARRCGLDPRSEVVIARRNGRWVYQRDWRKTRCGATDVVVFAVMPRGSGTLRSVAMLAVMVVAAIVAPPIVAAIGLTGAAATAATAALTFGIGIAGSYLVNALIPLPRPDTPGLSGGILDADSPTYAFTASSQQNLSRLGGKIPEWFGYHRVIPDLAATAWWEWADGKQKLYQTLLLSKGEIDIERIELGSTPIDTFEDVTYKSCPPGVAADLFEPNVYQSRDVGTIELTAPNDLVSPDDGLRGPFIAVPAGQATDRIGIDISFPRGLFVQSGTTLDQKSVQWKVEAQIIDDAGAPLGNWFLVSTETYTSVVSGNPASSSPGSGVTVDFRGGIYQAANKRNSPLTVSYRYRLPQAARYQVRISRLDNKDTSIAAGHDVSWSGLRSFLGGTNQWSEEHILQVAITATASVNDRIARQIAVTGTRKLPTFDPVLRAWTAPQPTRAIAWAAAHVLLDGNGGRLNTSQIDMDALLALHDLWQSRGNTFDYYASEARSLWEMLEMILRCGRAVPYRQGGMIRFFRDGPQQIPVTGFSRENIVARSLKIEYRLPDPEDDADGIEVVYFDRRTWNFNSLRKSFSGPDQPQRPIRRTLDGCIEIDRAREELDYYVADYRLRTIAVTFDAEMEGFYPSYGDLVLFAHDSPKWGQSVRVLSFDWGALSVELFSPPIWTFNPADGWQARIRDIRGRYSAPVAIAEAPSATTIVLAAAPVYDDGTAFDFSVSETEFLHVMLGRADDAPRKALVRSVVPRQGGRHATVKLVLEDDAVHVN